jgi:hypothetical protein
MARSNTVVAKEAIVINVGARPPEYDMVRVIDNKTGEPVMIPKDQPTDPGDEGVPFAFKRGQKVSKNHEAVKACPGAFLPLDEAEELLDEG